MDVKIDGRGIMRNKIFVWYQEDLSHGMYRFAKETRVTLQWRNLADVTLNK